MKIHIFALRWKDEDRGSSTGKLLAKMCALQSEDTIEISSSNFVFSHFKFLISNFFVDEECAEN